jgi:protein-tyrosine phosphatase
VPLGRNIRKWLLSLAWRSSGRFFQIFRLWLGGWKELLTKTCVLPIRRLPMAEGFAPPSPEVLDSHLSYLITKYTLRGQNCLVHCRGGVGRAGLFACSWMIKLGLLGPITAIHDPSYNFLEKEMQIVENVIAVIRKRRSAKAIETPQQVQFILQYVHWLASSGRQVTATEIMQEVRTQG